MDVVFRDEARVSLVGRGAEIECDVALVDFAPTVFEVVVDHGASHRGAAAVFVGDAALRMASMLLTRCARPTIRR